MVRSTDLAGGESSQLGASPETAVLHVQGLAVLQALLAIASFAQADDGFSLSHDLC